MPYLEENHKQELEKVMELDHDATYIASHNTKDFAGAVNYLNFVIAKKRFAEGSEFKKYYQFALWTGTMLCCVLEVYRRLIAPYEDEAIKRNGDVE